MLIFNTRRDTSLPGLSLLPVFLTLLLALVSPQSASASSHSHHRHSGSIATYYSQGDSNPHLANGDWYGKNGPWFCAVDSSQRHLLNHRIEVVNTQNGLRHIFLVADLGRFPRGNLDISRGGSSRLSGRSGPDNFPIEWHDLGPASQSKTKRHRQHTKG